MTPDDGDGRMCKYCGDVLTLGSIVRLGAEGEYEYACGSSAVEVRP